MIATCRLGTAVGFFVALASVSAEATDFPELVEQLDNPNFSTRQAASQQLAEAGAEAMPALEQAIAHGSREASSRALDLFKRQLHDGSDESKAAARESLQRLADSNHASTAQRARDILTPPAARTGAAPFGQIPMPNGRGRFNNVQFQGANVPFPPVNNPAGMFAGVRRVTFSEINGRRGVEIAEQHRVIKMDTWPTGAVEIASTDKLNGRDVTRRIQAKDRDELVRKDPETAKMYDQFHRGGAPGLMPGFGVKPVPARFNSPLMR
jgi:hypothetical protein